MRRLADRVAVVTGAASGIGAAAARRLAQEGAYVVLADINNAEALASELGGLAVQVDVSDAQDVSRLFATALQIRGRIDISFHNAGICPPEDGPILELEIDGWRRVQEVNLTSVYLCCKEVLPIMLKQGSGSIINTSSTAAMVGAATSQLSYTASKGAVLALTRELGVQFARDGVRVNSISPGPVATPLTSELFATQPAEVARRMVHIPMGRFADAAEVASVVAFLSSDDASFITASNLPIDGGICGAYVTPE